jgi:hypothetical protein
MAVVPGMWDPAVPPPPTPCAIAIELRIKAPLAMGEVELHVMAGEVDRIWAPYGVTFCWSRSNGGCDGLEVRLRVQVAQRAELPGPAMSRRDVLGWIGFVGSRPGTEIVVSADAARAVVARARVGSRPLAAWPPAFAERYVPRVLGRALAHEIGHFVLASRAHTRTGLMAPSFPPDRAAFEGASRFDLPSPEAARLRRQCEAVRLARSM